MRFLDMARPGWLDRKMLQEIRYCAVPPAGFVYPLPVQRLVCIWPTYDGYAKEDLDDELSDEVEQAWSEIVCQAVEAVCERLGWVVSTLEYRKTPSYWDESLRTWHLVEQSLDRDFVAERQQFGHEFYLHLVGPEAIRDGAFFPDDLPLIEWLGKNYAFVLTGVEEPVLWSYWPNHDLFLEEVQRASREHGHQMVLSKERPFLSHKITARDGPFNYSEIEE